MTIESTICGIAKQDDVYTNMITLEGNFADENVKEIAYNTGYNEINSLIGFKDVEIISVGIDSEIARAARVALMSDPDCEAIIFVKGGYMVVKDLMFFTAYIKVGNTIENYISEVEENIYDDEEALQLIEENPELV